MWPLLVVVIDVFLLVNADDARYHGNPQEVVFPGPISRSSTGSNHLVKTLELAKELSKIQSVEEFFKLVNVAPLEKSYPVALADRFGGTERTSAIKPKPAICKPEPQVVPVKENPDPAAIYFPNCIRINRCGGCCNHELLSCQPTAIETHNYQIHVTRLEEESGEYSVFKEIVPLDEHKACQCDCKIKEQDCTEKHYYNKEECRCICQNNDEEYKCRQASEKKYWNADNCSCQCRRVEECSTGYYFDQSLCSCKSLSISRLWFNDDKRTGYNIRPQEKPKGTPPVIYTLDATDPRRKHKDDPIYK